MATPMEATPSGSAPDDRRQAARLARQSPGRARPQGRPQAVRLKPRTPGCRCAALAVTAPLQPQPRAELSWRGLCHPQVLAEYRKVLLQHKEADAKVRSSERARTRLRPADPAHGPPPPLHLHSAAARQCGWRPRT